MFTPPLRLSASAAALTLAIIVPGAVAETTPAAPSPRPGQLLTVAGGEDSSQTGDDEALGTLLGTDLAIATGSDGTLVITDRDRERLFRVDSNGRIARVEGIGSPAPGQEEPAGSIGAPYASVATSDGGLVVSGELGITRVDPAGAVTPLTSTGDGVEGTGDGQPVANVRVVRALDIAVDAAGSLYFPDPAHALIRKVDTAGVITTIAGGGGLSPRESEGLPATGANVGTASHVAVDSQENVYFMVEDEGAVFKVDAAGVLTMVTGTASRFGGDGGPAIDAQLNGARAIAVDAHDNLLIADGNGFIRQVDPAGTITTVSPWVESVDDIAATPSGDVYIASSGRIDRLVRSGAAADDEQRSRPSGTTSPWADEEPGSVHPVVGVEQKPEADPDPAATPEDGPALDAVLGPLTGFTVAADNSLYLADGEHLDTVDPEGALRPLPPPHPALAAAPALAEATAVASTSAGDLYAAIGSMAVRVHPDGGIVPVAGGGSVTVSPDGGQNALTAALDVADIAIGPGGELYIADREQRALYVLEDDDTLAVHAELDGEPGGLAVAPDGTVYIALPAGNRVVAVDVGGTVTTAAGTGTQVFEGTDLGDGGPATEAVVAYPSDVAVDSHGNVYLSTALGIRRVDTDGTITTVYSTARETGGTLASAGPQTPLLAIGPQDDLYFFEVPGNQVKVIVRPGEIATPFPWLWVVGAVAVVLVIVVIGYLRRRRGHVQS